MQARWRTGLAAALCALALAASARPALQPGDDPAASPVWQQVRTSLFERREVLPAPPGMLVLDVPGRAVDAAVVPLAMRVRMPAGTTLARLVLVIDANPSPISAIFAFTGADSEAAVETRVRVDDYSWVRAIAETGDGRLYSVVRFVKASGGCSAPAGSDAAEAAARLGQLRLRADAGTLQLVVSHPNHSGLAMDQATRQITPAHFVRKVDVTLDGRPVFSADVDFSISENPNFRFPLAAASGDGLLRATVVDSNGRRFDLAQTLREAQAR